MPLGSSSEAPVMIPGPSLPSPRDSFEASNERPDDAEFDAAVLIAPPVADFFAIRAKLFNYVRS